MQDRNTGRQGSEKPTILPKIHIHQSNWHASDMTSSALFRCSRVPRVRSRDTRPRRTGCNGTRVSSPPTQPSAPTSPGYHADVPDTHRRRRVHHRTPQPDTDSPIPHPPTLHKCAPHRDHGRHPSRSQRKHASPICAHEHTHDHLPVPWRLDFFEDFLNTTLRLSSFFSSSDSESELPRPEPDVPLRLRDRDFVVERDLERSLPRSRSRSRSPPYRPSLPYSLPRLRLRSRPRSLPRSSRPPPPRSRSRRER